MPVPHQGRLQKKSKRTLVNRAIAEAAASTGLPRTAFKRSKFEAKSKRTLARFITGRGKL